MLVISYCLFLTQKLNVEKINKNCVNNLFENQSSAIVKYELCLKTCHLGKHQ